jgi:hypothetical protein
MKSSRLLSLLLLLQTRQRMPTSELAERLEPLSAGDLAGLDPGLLQPGRGRLADLTSTEPHHLTFTPAGSAAGLPACGRRTEAIRSQVTC